MFMTGDQKLKKNGMPGGWHPKKPAVRQKVIITQI